MQSPSAIRQYNEELALAHREAIAALRELLATEKDPTERRRLAIAILKARPIKDPAVSTASPRSGGEGAAGFAAADEGALLRHKEQLEAITALLDIDTPSLQRLFGTHSPQPAGEQPHAHAAPEPSPLCPIHQAAA